MNDGIIHSTEELYHRYLSGEKVKDISIQTGLSKGSLYKRFQRFKKIQHQTQVDIYDENAEEIKSTEQVLQSENFDWEENILAGVLSFVTVFLGVFFYRKYDGERIMN